MNKGRLSARSTTARELVETHFYAPGLQRWVVAKVLADGELKERSVEPRLGAVGFAVLPYGWEDPFESTQFAHRVREAKSRARMAAEFMMSGGKEKLPTETVRERTGNSTAEAFKTFALQGRWSLQAQYPVLNPQVISELKTDLSAAEASHVLYCFGKALDYAPNRCMMLGENYGQAYQALGRSVRSLHAGLASFRFTLRGKEHKGIYMALAKRYLGLAASQEHLNMVVTPVPPMKGSSSHLISSLADKLCDFYDLRLDRKEQPCPSDAPGGVRLVVKAVKKDLVGYRYQVKVASQLGKEHFPNERINAMLKGLARQMEASHSELFIYRSGS